MLTAQQRLANFTADRERLVALPILAPGSTRRQALTRLTDSWLSSLFDAATPPTNGVALVAVGGYGRRELSPGSDLDVLLLHSPGVRIGALADAIWYPIWDAGLRLDHSVRTPVQARRLANNDLKVMLGLLDARTVAGDETLLASLRTSALADWRARAANRLGELKELVALRRRVFGELAYLVEPDLKDAIGGLRDVVIMRAIAASWVTDVPRTHLAGPYEVLLDVRDALHVHTGRRSDKLIRQEQAALAATLGVADPRSDGDGLLRRVAAAGRTIDWASDMVWHRVNGLVRPARLPGVTKLGRTPRPRRVPLTEGAVIDDGEVVLARDARPDRDPGLVLRLAAATARAGLRVAPATVAVLAKSAAPLPPRWSDAMRNDFIGLLGAGRGLWPVWESLDQEGLIVRLLPEWAPTRSAPQHNPVHLHTVDRHMVETTMRAAAYARDVARPDLLLVAAVLHDIGKPAGADQHCEVGADLVEVMLARMGFGTDDAATVQHMVRHHLLLADTATRRDIHDPDTIGAVAQKVGTAEQLELLWALTRADAEATGPAAWTPWKAALVDSLVEQVAGLFAGRPDLGVQLPSETESVAMSVSDVVVLREERGGLEELVIGAPRAALPDIAGVLALHRLAVIEARASVGQQRSVSTWRVTPAFGVAPDAHRLAVDLRRALAGTLSPRQRLADRDAAVTGAVAVPEPQVRIAADASASATVIEVRAGDSPGLLYRLLIAIDTHGGQVRAAKVDTLGADVVDVFYLVDLAGQPLSAAAAQTLAGALAAAAATPAACG